MKKSILFAVVALFLASPVVAQKDGKKETKDPLQIIKDQCKQGKNSKIIREKLEELRKDANEAENYAEFFKGKPQQEEAKKKAEEAKEKLKEAEQIAGGIVKAEKVIRRLKDKREEAKRYGECDGEIKTAEKLLDAIEKKAKELSDQYPCDSLKVMDELDAYVKQLRKDPNCDKIKEWIEKLFPYDVSKKKYEVCAYPRQTFMIQFTGGISFGHPVSRELWIHELQASAFEPTLFGTLFKNLDGEFLIGKPASIPTYSMEMPGRTKPLPGFRIGMFAGDHLEFHLGGLYFRNEWITEFPVMVFRYESPEPQEITGTAVVKTSGLQVDAEGRFLPLLYSRLRPFVKAGIRAQFPLRQSGQVSISTVSWDMNFQHTSSNIAPFGGAGVRWQFHPNISVETSALLAKAPTGRWAPAAEMAIGFSF